MAYLLAKQQKSFTNHKVIKLCLNAAADNMHSEEELMKVVRI